MKLPPAWNELIASLLSHRVRFLVVGAHALAVHGRPRATQALDILVEPTLANAKRLHDALVDFGFPALAREWRRFAEPDRMATLGREPLRVDIMTSISGVAFAEAWRTRVRAPFGAYDLSFLGRNALVSNKRASGRTKDLLDIALLEEVQPEGTKRERENTRRRTNARRPRR